MVMSQSDLRGSLDTLRVETDKQAGYHATLAQQIKDELEGGVNIFLNREMQHKRQVQVPIEKEYKTKQQQEAHVSSSMIVDDDCRPQFDGKGKNKVLSNSSLSSPKKSGYW